MAQKNVPIEQIVRILSHNGVGIRERGGRLVVGPKDRMTDSVRTIVARHKSRLTDYVVHHPHPVKSAFDHQPEEREDW